MNAETPEPEAPSIDLLAPFFPAYEFEGFVAQGGMGAVYKARQRSLDRPVAIKILPQGLGEDRIFQASFEAEAKAMARLNHPNLIGVYDFGEAGGMHFIVMEFVAGKSLYHSAAGKAIDPAVAGKLVSGICRGLEHAHAHGILHRDIKPGNILLDEGANPKIGDFGLAMPIGHRTDSDEPIYGTPGYTAPEVYGREPASPRTDVFSVGVILHELLTGSLPDEHHTPPSLVNRCPREFDAIVARATHASTAIRYQSAKELADDLDLAVAKLGSPAAIAASRIQLAAPAVRKPTPAAAASKKSPAISLGLIAAAIGIGVFTAIAVQSNRGKRAAEKPTSAAIPLRKALAEDGEPAIAEGAEEIFAAGASSTGGQDQKPSKESPLKSLAALKSKLLSGARDEFPPGTESHEGSHYLLVDAEMDWQAARRFAEEHGAHLAVLPFAEDRSWFTGRFQPASPIWLGGGIAGYSRWQWIDGTRWIPAGAPTQGSDSMQFLALSPDAQLEPKTGGESYQFAIQWHLEAANPGTIRAELLRTAEAIKAGGESQVNYPVGTRTFSPDDSHYYAIETSIPWDEARQLAMSAGGYLAVPSSQAECQWMQENFAISTTGRVAKAYWLGGYRLKPGDPWRWLTREAWTFAGWKAEPEALDPKQNRVVLLADSSSGSSTWIARDAIDGASTGFLVEWSRPKEPAEIETFDLDAWLIAADNKIKQRVSPELARYQREKGEIIDRYVRAMKREARNRKSDRFGGFPGRRAGPGSGGFGDWDAWRGEKAVDTVNEAMEKVEAAQALVVRIPEFAPGEFRDIQSGSESEIKKLDTEFETRILSQREFYSSGLLKQSEALAKSGFVDAGSRLEERAQLSRRSTNEFLALLGLAERSGSD